jgi:hypothetical protein
MSDQPDDAARAYHAALAEIERVRTSGGEDLSFR